MARARRFPRVVPVAAVLVLSALVPGVANAGTAEVAPGCVRLDQWETQDVSDKEWNSWARMTNHCDRTFTVRMIWSWARDGECRILDPGTSWTEGRLGPHPSVSELRRC